MEEILHQLIGSIIPLWDFYIPGGARFQPSAVALVNRDTSIPNHLRELAYNSTHHHTINQLSRLR